MLRKAYTDCKSHKSKSTDKPTLTHTTKPKQPITATKPCPASREPPKRRKQPNLNLKRPVKPQNTYFFVGHSQEVRKKMYISEVHLESYLLDNRGLSTKNVATIVRNIRAIQRVWGILEPSNENALLLKAAMREKGRSPNAIRQYMWALKYWAKSYGKDIDFKAVPLPKPQKTVPRILDFEVVRNIIGDESLSLRDRVIFMLFAFTACRVGELASINIKDIDHKERTILLHDTKTRKEKVAPIPPKYYSILSVYLDARAHYLAHTGHNTDALIVSERTWTDEDGHTHNELTCDGIRQAIYRIGERYGIDGPTQPGERRKRILHPHTMRHTATTKLMEQLGNPEEVMRITGHSSSDMLDWYSHPHMERIRAKMDSFHY
jgi:integrase